MQRLVGDQYVDVLWKSAMVTGFLWGMDQRTRKRDGQATIAAGLSVPMYQAGFGRLNGDVYTMLMPNTNLENAGLDVHIAIKDIAVNPVGDEYGNLHHAVLKVEYRLWPAAFLDDRLRYRYLRRYGAQVPFIDIGLGEWMSQQDFNC